MNLALFVILHNLKKSNEIRSGCVLKLAEGLLHNNVLHSFDKTICNATTLVRPKAVPRNHEWKQPLLLVTFSDRTQIRLEIGYPSSSPYLQYHCPCLNRIPSVSDHVWAPDTPCHRCSTGVEAPTY